MTGTRSAESIMASGHVQCRTNRPNTWQLRPAGRYQSKPLTTRSRPHMAHFGLSSPPAAESVIGGTADILSGNQNRPFLTLNGHLGAVQQMAAPAPIVLMEFFERWSEYLGFIHGFSKNQLGGIVFFAGLFYMTAPMVHEVILRSRTELSALLRKFRLVKISTLSTQSMANGRSA